MDGIHANAVGREFDGPRLGKPREAPFGGSVVAEARHATQPRDGGIVDDDARALRDHERDDGAGYKPATFEIDVEHGVPGIFAEFMRQGIAADAGVVEENVEPAPSAANARRRRGLVRARLR